MMSVEHDGILIVVVVGVIVNHDLFFHFEVRAAAFFRCWWSYYKKCAKRGERRRKAVKIQEIPAGPNASANTPRVCACTRVHACVRALASALHAMSTE